MARLRVSLVGPRCALSNPPDPSGVNFGVTFGGRDPRARGAEDVWCEGGMASADETRYGFLGLGIMGTAMAHRLVQSGRKVTVWNRTEGKCDELVAEGANKAGTPAQVVQQCDITFAMLSTPEVALEVALGDQGVAQEMKPGKGYVDMSTVDARTAQCIAKGIHAKGGSFLEAPVSGSKKPAIDGTLIVLAAGDKDLYDSCKGPFEVFSKWHAHLGEVGAGAKMKLVVNMIMGSMMGAFSEGMCLAEEAGLSQELLSEILSLGACGNPMFKLKTQNVVQKEFPPAFPLKHQQKDMRLALALGDELAVPMPVSAAANESFKRARQMGLGDNDMSAVYMTTQK